MGDNNSPDIKELNATVNEAEIIEKRSRLLENFADWMIKSGLSPLDYVLVEEKSGDGVTFWYFRKKIDTNEVQIYEGVES